MVSEILRQPGSPSTLPTGIPAPLLVCPHLSELCPTDCPFCSLGICSLRFSPLDVFSGPLGPTSVVNVLFSAVILLSPITWHIVLSLLVILLCCPTPVTSDHLSSSSLSGYFIQKSLYCLFSIYCPCAELPVSCGLHNLICSTGLQVVPKVPLLPDVTQQIDHLCLFSGMHLLLQLVMVHLPILHQVQIPACEKLAAVIGSDLV